MENPKLITLSIVKQTAKEFLQAYHPSLELPIPIEDIVELKLKIRIILIKGLIRDFGVNAFISQGFDTIVIDEIMFSRQPERIRFTVAEEVGHLFLHKDWYVKNGPRGFENYLQWQQTVDGKMFDYIERQAKTFASMVLMPEAKVIERWSVFVKHSNLPNICKVFDLPDTFPELAHEFLVSPDSLLVRLSHLKLVQIPDGFWNKVKKR